LHLALVLALFYFIGLLLQYGSRFTAYATVPATGYPAIKNPLKRQYLFDYLSVSQRLSEKVANRRKLGLQ